MQAVAPMAEPNPATLTRMLVGPMEAIAVGMARAMVHCSEEGEDTALAEQDEEEMMVRDDGRWSVLVGR